MAKKITGYIRLQIPAGAANPSPPIGPALGQAGCNIMEFCKQFNAATQAQSGMVIPVVITVYQDRSFSFICKSPPAAVLLKKAAGLASAAQKPGYGYVGKVTKAQILEIAQIKKADLNARDVEAAAAIIAEFDETVDLALKLGIDPRKSDQNVRGAVALPYGTGKTVRVCVVADGAQAEDAKAAGADIVGYDDIVAKIKDGWLDFDILIATGEAMKLVRPLGRQLGPRGLMPNPKTGTVTEQVGNAVKEAKAGRAEFRADRGACVHVPIGKLSFSTEALCGNYDVVIDALMKAKPASAKGAYILSCTVSSTMSPGVKVVVKDTARQK